MEPFGVWQRFKPLRLDGNKAAQAERLYFAVLTVNTGEYVIAFNSYKLVGIAHAVSIFARLGVNFPYFSVAGWRSNVMFEMLCLPLVEVKPHAAVLALPRIKAHERQNVALKAAAGSTS